MMSFDVNGFKVRRQLGLLAFVAVMATRDLFGASFSELNPSAAVQDSEDKFQRGVNYRSERGVASSKNLGGGSDGRLTSNPTPGQFSGFVNYGASVRPNPARTGSMPSSPAARAGYLDLPRNSGQVTTILKASLVGSSTFSRLSAFRFGQVITPPLLDINDTDLTLEAALAYWEPKPFNDSSVDFYYSPHAEKIYATKSGPVNVTWRRVDGQATQPSGTENVDYVLESGFYYQLKQQAYVVSGNAIKAPQKIYWTEGAYRGTGKPVTVPQGRVRDVKFVYNTAIPEEVAADQAIPTGSPVAGTNGLVKTIWYDIPTGQILAYNKEGRIFVELLGDITGPGTRSQLGVEIVDVFEGPVTVTVTNALGERVTPYQDRQDLTLYPEPLLSAIQEQYLFLHNRDGDPVPRYYAVKETENPNDVQIHWMRTGEAGLKWPLVFTRSKQVWPDSPAAYSHYLRPIVASVAEAADTAVSVPGDNNPTLQYQDRFDAPRGFINEKPAYYSYLTTEYPWHRALIRYSAGNEVTFERVFSVLDQTVRTQVKPVATLQDFPFDYGLIEERSSFLNLDGTGYGQMPDESSAFRYFDARHDHTVEAWVYVRTATVNAHLLDMQGERGRVRIAEQWNHRFALSHNATGNPSVHSRYAGWSSGRTTSGETLATGRWVHFAYTHTVRPSKNWGGTGRIYLDGVLVGERVDSAYSAFSVLRHNCYVGKSSLAGSGLLNAAIDNLRIWSVARTAGELLVDRQTAVYPSDTTGLKVQYTFDEVGTQGVAQDSSGNGRDMVLHGGAGISRGTPALPSVYSATELASLPRMINDTAEVGNRLTAPSGELGSGAGEAYVSGHVRIDQGRAIYPAAYQDPLTAGFAAANNGAIIPVNAIPGQDLLEVWWFRENSTNAVRNSANGFLPVHWPSVMARYTLRYPTNSSEIVMASNDGSGALPSLQAKGGIYRQNDSTAAGYNPNEEHALMVGGQVFALRDDLNLMATNSPAVLAGGTATYSSEPFVLLTYTAADGRPSIRPFRVLREKPEDGILFDYVVTAGGNVNRSGAGSPLQAPMPLPLLPAPTELLTTVSAGITNVVFTNYNQEPVSAGGVAAPSGLPATAYDSFPRYLSYTFKDRKENFWVHRGAHAGNPILEAGSYDTMRFAFETNMSRAVAIEGQAFEYVVHSSRLADSLVLSVADATPLPDGLAISGLTISGTPTALGVSPTPYVLNLVLLDVGDSSRVELQLTMDVVSAGTLATQGQLVITRQVNGESRKFVGRPPVLTEIPTATNSFAMRFYYKNQDTFDWPQLGTAVTNEQIVPYLRPLGSVESPADRTTPSLDIVYRPVWPGNPPQMALGQTLTVASAGLPAMRGQTSIDILYQQGIAQSFDLASGATQANRENTVVLHDPTRSKNYAFGADSSSDRLAIVPAGIATEASEGKTFFPRLPPHLVNRLFYDPTISSHGALVFNGEFKDELLGEKYLLLNVMTPSDLTVVKELCPTGDENKRKWDDAIDGLSTTVESFVESPVGSGLFVVDSNLTTVAGISALPTVISANTAVDSFALTATGPRAGYVSLVVGQGNGKVTPVAEPVTVYVLRVMPRLHRGELKVILSENPLNEQLTLQHSADLGGKADEYEYEWKIAPPVDGFPPLEDSSMSAYQSLATASGLTRYTLGSSGIQGLIDNYVVLRYRPTKTSHPLYNQWSEWVRPALAEGWVKRVLAGINPFNQRITSYSANAINTDASMLIQAGRRWEGDIPLNLQNINNFGLIEIYETVLNRAKGLSIDAGINFAPANDTLMLAAGYINDLYMFLGNEAFADAANPTIGISSSHNEFGSIATALFAFKGQVPTLLEEELGMLRGRSDFAQPGVEVAPLYNRMVWNYTRGINSGEVIYAQNYNILDQNDDGVVDAADAAILYPQGHGDAYGHYLTALKGYYRLLQHPEFEWVPRIEAVTVLGQPVTVDFLDERKFATTAAAVARTGLQVYELEWRRHYDNDNSKGWPGMGVTNSTRRTYDDGGTIRPQIREWGADQWASRTGQGAFFNWVVGNAILPDVDPDPSHEGIQKIDRTTVLELQELPSIVEDLQQSADNAEAHLSPLGIAERGMAFDINPDLVISNGLTHFEQVYARAIQTLQNAATAFDDTKEVTSLMRGEIDSLDNLQHAVDDEERAFNNELIEIYGTPYADDIGPGNFFEQGYVGPDLVHYSYVDLPEHTFPGLWSYTETDDFTGANKLEIRDVPASWGSANSLPTSLSLATFGVVTNVEFNIGSHGFFSKPSNWTGRRSSPGQLQQAASEIISTHTRLRQAWNDAVGARNDFMKVLETVIANRATLAEIRSQEESLLAAEEALEIAQFANELFEAVQESVKDIVTVTTEAAVEAVPKNFIAGLAAGGDVASTARLGISATKVVTQGTTDAVQLARKALLATFEKAVSSSDRWVNFYGIAPLERTMDQRAEILELSTALGEVQLNLWTINEWTRQLDDAWRKYRALEAEGLRIQAHREAKRKRNAAVVQGFRTRDAAFRIFRAEKLERYKRLFDLAARYTLLAANAYDYETGLLTTTDGQNFVNRILNARSLGVIIDGVPHFAGSNTGDPGLSSILAEMRADWDVLRSRLGFNNPQKNNTTFSLRSENYRILADASGDAAWRQTLQNAVRPDISADPDVARHCLQVQPGPGLILEFSTMIADGTNLFGQPLAPGDHNYSPTEFATKIYAAGVALSGYVGMDDPTALSQAIGLAGATSPADPQTFGTNGLAATPYLYLIPVGADSMRTPPLGDRGGSDSIRTWFVSDLAIPLPFNIGGSDFSNKPLYRTSDSLTEPLFALRKHPAFRPVENANLLAEHSLNPGSFFRSKRLIGRSVWNTRWKVVIPGRTLLNDPAEGLARFVDSVKDVKLNFVTYSYAGN